MSKHAMKFAAAVDLTIMEMSAGSALHCEFVRGTQQWWLTNGRRIPTAVATAVTAKRCVVSVGDGLFRDTVARTYRLVGPTKKRRQPAA